MSTAGGPHDHGRGPIAQHIALAGQPRDVPAHPVLGLPGLGVGHERAAQLAHVATIQVRAHGVVERGYALVQGGRQVVVPLVDGLVVPVGGRHDLAQSEQVGRSAGLGRRADRRALPAPEGLTAHDRAGDAPVDVEVPGLDRLQPDGELLGVEGVQARGQAVIDGVDRVDRLLKSPHPHDAQHRGEVLGEVELAAGRHAHADARAPQAAAQIPRSQDPVLAGPQDGQAPQGLLVVGHDDGAELGVQVLGAAHPQ